MSASPVRTPSRRIPFGRRFALALTVAALAALGLPVPAAAAATVTLEYTGASQTWTVPVGVTQATFDLYGAQGGGAGSLFAPGLGGRATATIAVTPGDTIQINVGGWGFDSPGFNGGGQARLFRGGGASDIRIGGTALDDRVIVAGGGGGANQGSTGGISGEGGDGGFPTGLPGGQAGFPDGIAGGGGTQSAGGTAGGIATPGEFGVGGNGSQIAGVTTGGGGGGGGWYGGGGGNNAGGGGGSSHGPEETAFETGVREGHGLVTVTFDTTAIADLADSVEALGLGTGVQKGLLKPLTAAQQSFDASDMAGTCDDLAVFIAQVDKKSPRKIAQADADALIEEATAVGASLGCAVT